MISRVKILGNNAWYRTVRSERWGLSFFSGAKLTLKVHLSEADRLAATEKKQLMNIPSCIFRLQ